MNVSLLRIVLWIALYIAMAEIGLEIRAHFRGFDTLLFGDFQQTDPRTKAAGGSLQADMVETGSGTKQNYATSGSVRYWIASSSHAEDSYLSREVIFPSVLERLLRTTGIQATIINASHAGMEIEDNTNDIESRGPSIKPDYVILYQMSSTITSLSKQLLSGTGSRTPRNDTDKAIPQKTRKPLDWTVWLVEQTALYAQLKGHLTSRLATKRVLADSLGGAGDAPFEAKIRAFIAATREIEAIPILCTFATSHVRRDLPNFPDSAVTLIFKYNIYLSLAGWVETIERFNTILRHIAEEEGIVLIDLEKTVAGQEDYFRDFVHFTPRGHAAVATVIRDALIANKQDSSQKHLVMN